MSKFSFSEKLGTYEITVEVLEAIENYFFNDISRLLNLTTDDIKKHFTIKLTDDLGDEEIKDTSELPLSLFSNSTRHIDISVKFSKPKRFKLSIILDEEKSSTLMRISYEGKNARETTKSICEGIKRILNHYKTNNYLFYPHDLYDAVLIMIVFGLFLGGFEFYKKGLYAELLIIGLPIIVFLFYKTLGKLFHPYTMFDSRKIRDYKRFNNWIFYGILGFIIFDIVLVILLKFWLPI